MRITSIADLGTLLRARREDARLDAQSAATHSGVGRRLLLEVEAGKRPNVSFATVLKLLALFGLELHVLPRGLPGTTPSADKGR
jgi:hypothetical protein